MIAPGRARGSSGTARTPGAHHIVARRCRAAVSPSGGRPPEYGPSQSFGILAAAPMISSPIGGSTSIPETSMMRAISM